MVNDSQYQHLISWNFSGTSFVVCNIMEFSRELLPKHFKHNNFSSFVRQLNMYGFHKVNKSPRGHRTMAENQIWEFSHPKFVRDRPDLLDQIKRKTMESESLRREAGDLHANFVMLQVSHTDLVKRVHHLQENLAEVIRELAETRKRQATQEGLVRQLLQALKQGGAAASLPQDLDMDAIASQSTRPSIFISDHDTNSLLHPELGYSASMSALGSQFHLGSGSLIATSQPPTSPIST
ncbi:HSF-type DNA-binding-domain-containing protein, partial [Coemansia mojavensis]